MSWTNSLKRPSLTRKTSDWTCLSLTYSKLASPPIASCDLLDKCFQIFYHHFSTFFVEREKYFPPDFLHPVEKSSLTNNTLCSRGGEGKTSYWVTVVASSAKKSHRRVRVGNWNPNMLLTMRESFPLLKGRNNSYSWRLICQQFLYKYFAC